MIDLRCDCWLLFRSRTYPQKFENCSGGCPCTLTTDATPRPPPEPTPTPTTTNNSSGMRNNTGTVNGAVKEKQKKKRKLACSQGEALSLPACKRAPSHGAPPTGVHVLSGVLRRNAQKKTKGKTTNWVCVCDYTVQRPAPASACNDLRTPNWLRGST